MAGCCKKKPLTEEQKQVLEAFAKSESPCGSKDIATATGLESKAVSCRITSLKKKGFLNSPVRCKYEITDDGRKEIS
jgi:predicted transcriptional regulator